MYVFIFLGFPVKKQNGGRRRLPIAYLQSLISTGKLPLRMSGRTFLKGYIDKLSFGISLVYSPEISIRTPSGDGGGRKGGTNTAIPHMVAREYRNTASQFTQIPKPQLPMGKS